MPKRPRAPHPPPSSNEVPPSAPAFAWLGVGILFVLWALAFLLRITAPPEILDNDQQRPAAYVLDVLRNGEWLVQRDVTGDVTSKPPLYTWVVAAFAWAAGGLNDWTLHLPGAFFVLAMTLLVVRFGRPWAGEVGALLGGLFFLVSLTGMRQLILARTDTLFSLLILAAALCAVAALQRRATWLGFAVFAGLACLTKGPLGVLLSAGGMLALLWEAVARPTRERPVVRRPDLLTVLGAVVLALIPALIWFLLARWIDGEAVTDKLIRRELVGHATKQGEGNPFQPTLYLLTRFFPWGLLFPWVVWRLVRWPDANPEHRFLERFALCHVLVGLVVFSLAPHQRADHLYPLLPFVALLVGREGARLLAWKPSPRTLGRVALAGVVGLLVYGVYLHAVRRFDEQVKRSVLVRDFAEDLHERFGPEFPFIDYDAPFGVQYYLGTRTSRVTASQAARALMSDTPAFVLVRDREALERRLPRSVRAGLLELGRWPREGEAFIWLLGNEAAGREERGFVYYEGPIRIEAEDVRLVRGGGKHARFAPTSEYGKLLLTNTQSRSRSFRVTLGDESHVLRLSPGQSILVDRFGVVPR